MKRCHRLVTLSASLALHGVLLLAVLFALSGETELGVLFIDLTAEAGPAAAGGAAGPPAPARAGREGAGALRPSVAARSAPPPSKSPASAEPSPAAEPASPRDPAAEAPARAPSATPLVPVEASQPDPTQVAAVTNTKPFESSGDAARSSATGAPVGSVTESGSPAEGNVLLGRGVRGGAPGGAPDVSHGFALAVPGGGGGGGVGPGAEYGAYLGRLRARVQQSLRYPLAARRRGLSGTVHVEIIIRPDGVISAVAVADSSAHAVLDDAAVETIRRLAPEPLPSDVPPRTLRVRLPVVFALE